MANLNFQENEKKIYKQGEDAYMSGKSIDDNPYTSDSVYWGWWDKAFKETARFWKESSNPQGSK